MSEIDIGDQDGKLKTAQTVNVVMVERKYGH